MSSSSRFPQLIGKNRLVSAWKFITLSLFLIAAILMLVNCHQEKITTATEPALPRETARIMAEDLYQQGQGELEKFTVPGYKEAIKYFEQVLARKPDFYQAYGRLAVAYGLWAKERKDLGLGNLDQWIEGSFYASRAEELGFHHDYLKASSLLVNSRTFITDYEYGEIFRSYERPFSGNLAENIIPQLRDLFESSSFKISTVFPALKNLDTILKDNPQEPEALLFKTLIEMATVDDENLKKVMALKPDWSLPYFVLGRFQRSRGEAAEASKWFKLALEKNPLHPRALAELGELAFLEKDYGSAEELLKQALSLDNEMLRAHLLSGFINREKGNYEEALSDFKTVTSLRPDQEEGTYNQALSLIELGRWPEALDTLNSLVKLRGSYEMYGYALKGLSYLMLDKLTEAETECRQALTISPNYYLPYYLLGLIYFKRQDFKKASEHFLESLKVDKTLADAHYYLGQTYLELKISSQAQEEIKKASDLFNFESGQIARQIEEAQGRGWTKKVELLARQKKELETKIARCQELLATS
jgi:tetratricopeptide (TPR) repeat protein